MATIAVSARWRDEQGNHVVKLVEPIMYPPARYLAHPWTHDTWSFHCSKTVPGGLKEVEGRKVKKPLGFPSAQNFLCLN